MALHFVDEQQGWLCHNHGGLVDTRDGGRTWSVEGRWPGTSVRAIWFGDAQSGWCAEVGGVYATEDGGRSWVRELESGGDPVVAVVFADQSQGWVLTFSGDVYGRND